MRSWGASTSSTSMAEASTSASSSSEESGRRRGAADATTLCSHAPPAMLCGALRRPQLSLFSDCTLPALPRPALPYPLPPRRVCFCSARPRHAPPRPTGLTPPSPPQPTATARGGADHLMQGARARRAVAWGCIPQGLGRPGRHRSATALS